MVTTFILNTWQMYVDSLAYLLEFITMVLIVRLNAAVNCTILPAYEYDGSRAMLN